MVSPNSCADHGPHAGCVWRAVEYMSRSTAGCPNTALCVSAIADGSVHQHAGGAINDHSNTARQCSQQHAGMREWPTSTGNSLRSLCVMHAES